MKLIVGLGNVGKEYENTRHNIGFMVADELAKRWGETKWKEADNAAYIEHRLPEKIFLIKPTTYMNLSGFAVADFANFYHIAPEDIAVSQDDCVSDVKALRAGIMASNQFRNTSAQQSFLVLKSVSAIRRVKEKM
jgi:PTH1 family peptidyl-tRNA hydrolase